jgi:hypothetical protein
MFGLESQSLTLFFTSSSCRTTPTTTQQSLPLHPTVTQQLPLLLLTEVPPLLPRLTAPRQHQEQATARLLHPESEEELLRRTAAHQLLARAMAPLLPTAALHL